jgi:uncharacterized protein
MYANGQGVAQDYAQAVAWYRKAADQGDADAQFNLGEMYRNGQSVAQDDAQAVIWYRKAADHGNALAQSNLGVAYANGQGVAQDYIIAHMWLTLAASRATETATRDQAAGNRDMLAAKMTRAQIEEAQRMAREWVQNHPSTR